MDSLPFNECLRISVADSGDGDARPRSVLDGCGHAPPERAGTVGVRAARADDVFRSFWMGGFEGADHRNSHGLHLDTGAITRHNERAHADYAALADFGIHAVRESAGWRLTERGGRFDFSTLEHRLEAARRCDIQIAWTLCHYGWPDDIDIFSDEWIDRFARWCRACASFIADRTTTTPVFTPINEISFLAWAVCETCLIHPHRGGRIDDAYGLKQRLVRAAMAASDVLWEIFPGARILNVDPMIHIVAPAGRPDLAEQAEAKRSHQFQAWDMLGGLIEPQLGGNARYLDIVGINYYHGNQWEVETDDRLHWHMNDARRIPLRSLIEEAHARYGQPMVIAETSHVGIGRGLWIREVAHDVAGAIDAGLPVNGICLYPVIDRPDWERPEHWHNSGLWDLVSDNGRDMDRVLCEHYAQQIRAAQRAIQAAGPAHHALPAAAQQPQPQRGMSWACS